MGKQAFRFLDLPPEIREKIYILICISPEYPEYLNLNEPDAHSSFPLDLLLANARKSLNFLEKLSIWVAIREIYHELRPLYLQCNAISFTIQRPGSPKFYRGNCTWSYILSPSWRDNLRSIRTLRIIIERWGGKDFFASQLAPALEDCILNGKLRDLEVRMMNRGHCEVDGARMGKATANWAALMSLLGDPYLERAVLLNGPYPTAPTARHLKFGMWEFDLLREDQWKKMEKK